MRINISVRYRTVSGQRLVTEAGGKIHEMKCLFGEIWIAEMTEKDFGKDRRFIFKVMGPEGILREEWHAHVLRFPENGNVEIRSRWLDRPANSAFYSSAFTKVIFGRERTKAGKIKGNLTIVVTVPEVRADQAIAIAGNGKTLPGWDHPILLEDWNFPTWNIDLDVKDAFEYKFLIVDRKTLKPVSWESGPNHFFAEIPAPGKHLVIADMTPSFQLPRWKGAGVAVPVFSLRSEDSFGTGDFHDLKKLADWASRTGLNLIQILPVNDTSMTGTWIDSYPYNANSSFALHPQYLYLPGIGVKENAEYLKEKKELESLPKVDYELVNAAKARYARKAFEKADAHADPAIDAFVKANASWLKPYAAYCILRDKNGTADFTKWGRYAKYSPRKAAEVLKENAREARFHYFVQYHLDRQLKEAAAYAHGKGIALKGDLPIGVSRTSCEVWTSPELFHIDSQAGAPPDAFATDGQNWGFPTYNWEKMQQDGFRWWKSRLRKMSEYFDAFRIDHILGFFRIWEIPVQYRSGLMGHFNPALPLSRAEILSYGFDADAFSIPRSDWESSDVLFIEDPRQKGYFHPRIGAELSSKAYQILDQWHKDAFRHLSEDFFYRRNNQFWRQSAMKKLPALLGATGMLACGEDLGMIPSCVPEVMDSLGILSLEIQRMPKAYGREFADTSAYPYMSVCSTGTHDMSPLRAWWKEDRDATGRFYRDVLHHGGDAPEELTPELAKEIVRMHLESPSMFTVIPIQDFFAMDAKLCYPGNPEDERINVPSDSRNYWRYRMHITLENL